MPLRLLVAAGREAPTTSHRPASLLVLALAATVARARAAEEQREERLGEVVVTAPPAPEIAPARDPTAFATVVDTTSAPTRVETLADALGDTVGVQVRRFGGLGDFSTVSIRGSSSGQVQVYLDGVPLGRAQNETVNLADLPLDAVDHVEVYRGATPLAFAQSGPGGIVNVVTRRPGDTPVTGASVSYGSFETRKVDLMRSARIGDFDYLAFGHYLGSQGDFTFLNDLGTTANPADDREERRRNNAFDLGDLTARLGWHPEGGPLAAALTTDTFVKDEGVPGVGSVQARDARLQTQRQLGHLDLDLTPAAGLPLAATGGGYVLYERQAFRDRRGEVALVPVDVEDQTTAAGAQALVRGALGAHQVPGLFLAASHERFAERDHLAPSAEPDRTRLRATIAGEDELLAAGERVALVPGLRWEVFRDDFPGGTGVPAALQVRGARVRDFLSPRLGLRVVPHPALTLLANAGRYAREPNLSELFGTRGVVVGNPRLRPETAFNRDGGFRLTAPPLGPLAHAALEYAYFDNQIDDLIVLVQNSQAIVRPENVTSAAVRGHEVSARGRLWERLGLTANYTHQHARDTGDVTFLRGKQLPGRPADEAFARLELAWSPLHPLPRVPRLWPGRLFYEANVIADNFLDRANVRQVGSRVLHDVGLELGLPLAGVRLTLEAKNVGDDRTRDALGFPLPGRALFATVSYGLGGREP
ncbi:MAG TPA: TonB-dependent receptor [Verrucomicrobiae bacterium]|nr:TonB-dependent receptor [Verrucomicrobiae bacterium]